MQKNFYFDLIKFADNENLPADKPEASAAPSQSADVPKPSEEPKKPTKKLINIVSIDSDTDKAFIALNFIDPVTKKLTLTPQNFRDLYNIADAFIEQNKTGTRYPIWGQINNKKSVEKILRSSGSHTILISKKLPKFVERIINRLSELDFDTKDLQSFLTDARQQQQQAAEAPTATYSLELLSNYNSNILNAADRRLFFGIRIKKSDGTLVAREMKDHLTFAIRSSGIESSALMEPGKVTFAENEGAYILNKCAPDALRQIARALKSKNIDVSDFESKIEEYAPYYTQIENQAVDARKIIEAEDASEDTKFYIAIKYPQFSDLKDELKYFVTCSFPTYGSYEKDMTKPALGPDDQPVQSIEPEGMRVSHDRDRKWYLYGKYDDFYQFGSMLKNLGWDVSQYIKVIEDVIKDEKLKIRYFDGRARIVGALDGYEITKKIKKPDGTFEEIHLRNADGSLAYDKAKFNSDIDEKVNPQLKLYEKQKDGVQWLYSRESAVLGDDTGTGKTITCAATAAMRARPDGKILIVTKKELIFQWAREINSKLQTPADKILLCLPKLKKGYEGLDYIFDANCTPEAIANAKWVLVAYPSVGAEIIKDANGQFALDAQGNIQTVARPRAARIINALRNTNFDVAILDEAHVVKNPGSSTSQALSSILPDIPFKYAATATPIANTPEDIHNLLVLIGHTLGKTSMKQFKESFVGQKLTLKSFDPRSRDAVAQQKTLLQNAEKADRLNKVLALGGVYLARSKENIREDMPTHTRDIPEYFEDQIDIGAFQQDLARAAAQVQGAAVLGKLTAQRRLLAKYKAPLTIAEAKRILDDSPANKVLIFSNFIEAINIISSELDAYIKENDPLYDPEAEANLANTINYKRVLTIKENMEGTSVQQAVDAFKDIESRARVMVISAKKGGTGISLENCTQHVIVNDYDWAPVTFKQTEGRAFRINSIDDVNTQYMVLKTRPNMEQIDPITLDGVMFEYVLNKIRIADRTQEVTSEMQNLVLNGAVAAPQYSKLQEEIQKLQVADMDADVKLRADLIRRGIIGENDDLDDLVEQIDALENEENPGR